MNVRDVQLGKNVRKSFAKINEVLDMPNLIEVQKKSYQWFLDEGLREVFHDVASIKDYNETLELSFIDYRIDPEPKYSIAECKERDTTYAAPLRVTARLNNLETGEIKDSEVYMGDFPLMTPSGTFVINGAERVIVSQLVRSPGVYYAVERDKTGKELFKSTVIPNRGAWLEYEMDSNDVVYVRIDKNRKIPITTFIRAIGVGTNDEIDAMFNNDPRLRATVTQKDSATTAEEGLIEVYKKLRPGEPPTVDSAITHLNNLFFDAARYDLSRFGRYKYNKKLGLASRLAGHKLSRPIADPLTGEIIAEPEEVISFERAEEIESAGVTEAYVTVEKRETLTSPTGEVTHKVDIDEVKIIGSGMVDISRFISFDAKPLGINEKVSFRVLREILENASGDDQIAEQIRLRRDELIPKHIVIDDIIATISYFLNLCEGVGVVDDIDHLGNRRIRSVGELLQNQFRIGFSRMERVIRERMNIQSQDLEVLRLNVHSLADDPLHSREADSELILQKLADRADAAVSEVVDVVDDADSFAEVEEIAYRRDDVVDDDVLRDKLVAAEANLFGNLVVAGGVLEDFPQYAERDLFVDAEGLCVEADEAGDVDHSAADNLDLVDVDLVGDLAGRTGERFALFDGDICLGDARRLDFLGALKADDLLRLGDDFAGQRVGNRSRKLVPRKAGGKSELFVVFVSSEAREVVSCGIEEEVIKVGNRRIDRRGLARAELFIYLYKTLFGGGRRVLLGDCRPKPRVVVEHRVDFVVGADADCADKGRNRNLSVLVDSDVYDVVRVHFVFEPCAAVRDNRRLKQLLAGLVPFDGIINAGRTHKL